MAFMITAEIARAMFGANKSHMTEEQTRDFVVCLMLERRDDMLPEEAKQLFAFQVIAKRLEAVFDEEKVATNALICFVAMITDRPGSAVLYAAVIADIYHTIQRTVTIADFCDVGRFADGFPPIDEIQKVWDEQKVGGSNSVDTIECWKAEAV